MAIAGISNGYMNPYYVGAGYKAAGNSARTDTAGAAAGGRATPGNETAQTGRAIPGSEVSQTGKTIPGSEVLQTGKTIPEGAIARTGRSIPGGVTGKTTPDGIYDPDKEKKAGRRSSPEECQTCKERKYQDGSDENVSFKAAAHISPEAAGAAVRAHESEHVSNAYTKAAEEGGEVINASVTIHTAICPECGRTYVSGGTTSTTIRYSKEENPYAKARKAQEAIRLRGKNIDYAA